MRAFIVCAAAASLVACGSSPQIQEAKNQDTTAKASAPEAHVKITQFYSPDPLIPRGMHGKLCYGVENASKVEISPRADDVWPSPARCFDISPKQKTEYTLTASGADGSKDTKSVLVNVGAAAPKLY